MPSWRRRSASLAAPGGDGGPVPDPFGYAATAFPTLSSGTAPRSPRSTGISATGSTPPSPRRGRDLSETGAGVRAAHGAAGIPDLLQGTGILHPAVGQGLTERPYGGAGDRLPYLFPGIADGPNDVQSAAGVIPCPYGNGLPSVSVRHFRSRPNGTACHRGGVGARASPHPAGTVARFRILSGYAATAFPTLSSGTAPRSPRSTGISATGSTPPSPRRGRDLSETGAGVRAAHGAAGIPDLLQGTGILHPAVGQGLTERPYGGAGDRLPYLFPGIADGPNDVQSAAGVIPCPYGNGLPSVSVRHFRSRPNGTACHRGGVGARASPHPAGTVARFRILSGYAATAFPTLSSGTAPRSPRSTGISATGSTPPSPRRGRDLSETGAGVRAAHGAAGIPDLLQGTGILHPAVGQGLTERPYGGAGDRLPYLFPGIADGPNDVQSAAGVIPCPYGNGLPSVSVRHFRSRPNGTACHRGGVGARASPHPAGTVARFRILSGYAATAFPTLSSGTAPRSPRSTGISATGSTPPSPRRGRDLSETGAGVRAAHGAAGIPDLLQGTGILHPAVGQGLTERPYGGAGDRLPYLFPGIADGPNDVQSAAGVIPCPYGNGLPSVSVRHFRSRPWPAADRGG